MLLSLLSLHSSGTDKEHKTTISLKTATHKNNELLYLNQRDNDLLVQSSQRQQPNLQHQQREGDAEIQHNQTHASYKRHK